MGIHWEFGRLCQYKQKSASRYIYLKNGRSHSLLLNVLTATGKPNEQHVRLPKLNRRTTSELGCTENCYKDGWVEITLKKIPYPPLF